MSTNILSTAKTAAISLQQDQDLACRAVVFIKPLAKNLLVESFLEQRLRAASIELLEKRDFSAEECIKRIDKHYSVYSAKGGALGDISEFKVNDEIKKSFKENFGVDWDSALVMTAPQAMSELSINPAELESKFRGTGIATGVKVAFVEHYGKKAYVINGFYPRMRAGFESGQGIVAYLLRFTSMSHQEFRKKFLGATNPAKAVEGSLRKELYDHYYDYGIKSQPDGTDNGFHGTAGPLEAAIEMNVWFGTDLFEVPFVQELLKSGLSREQVKWLTTNPDIVNLLGNKECIFDFTEEMSPEEAVSLILAIMEQFPS